MGLKLKIDPRTALTAALRLGTGLVLLAGLVPALGAYRAKITDMLRTV